MGINPGPYDRGELRPGTPPETPRRDGDQPAMSGAKPVSWLAVARSLKLQGPTDMSVRLHEYLYGEYVDAEE